MGWDRSPQGATTSEEHAEGPPLTRMQRTDGLKCSEEENEQAVGMDSE